MRLTFREKEILDVLKKQPLISQDELSEKFEISRSSVAVHISNLIKKGFILGKGYVFNEQVSMVVCGENGLEIHINENDKGSAIDLKYGGVSEQISQILSRFGVNVKLVTALGNDDVGTVITEKLRENQIDISNIYRWLEKRTCRKVIVDGNVKYIEGFSLEEYEKVLQSRLWIISNCEWLIVEEKFQKMIISLSAENYKMPILCTYKFIKYPEDIPFFLARYNVLLLGLENSQYLDYYSNKLIQLGEEGYVTNGIITDGTSRVVCVEKSGINDFLLPPNQSFDTQDKLPLFLAGLVYGLSMGQPLRQAVRIGVGTAT